MRPLPYVLPLFIHVLAAAPAFPWGAPVHRMITRAALDTLPPELPAWLRDPALRDRAAFQSNEPDRWRGWNSPVLKHLNDPDHFLDVELLDAFGLKLAELPPLRGEYLRRMAAAKALHPEKLEPYDPNADPARTQEWPGFLPYAIAEHYAKLQAAFRQVRILEQLAARSPEQARMRGPQLEQARANAVYHLGVLAHFVADAAQPLHTTKHYNGWVGPNPAEYKWRDKFHQYVDEGLARERGLTLEKLRPGVTGRAPIRADDPWPDVLTYVERSFRQVAPLYALERDGRLTGPDGEKLLLDRLTDAANTLGALLRAAWTSSTPDEKAVENWAKYEAGDE